MTASSTTDAQANPLAIIAPEMLLVDDVIRERLHSEVALVGQVSQYIIQSGGKRLRPALLLLMCGALGHHNTHRHTLAAVVEFIHTATLLHDDVVDESTLRRGRDTANELFGNAASVLVGDFLYSRAFQMMVDAGDMRIMQILANATNVIAEGEVLQLMNMHDAQLTRDGYLHVIQSKTAKLFEASTRLAAVLGQCDTATEEACAAYGAALGTAFQIIDDVLDYEGEAQELGKNLGDDLREGKLTLPVICTLEHAQGAERDLIVHAIENGDLSQLARISALVKQHGGLTQARDVAQLQAQHAIAAIAGLPDNAYTQALRAIAESLLHRRN
ncbi:MAG: polyprenyl synthetase family protein [Burkholderiaceae bacterium]|nr:polyprenyl synthetase family protein [Burkholderiaceae bacterium]